MENCSFGCPDTFAPSYISSATSKAGAVAALAEERKKNIYYAHLDPSHSFTPVAVETSGVVGPQSLAFLKDLGRRMRQVTGEERSLSYLRILQRVSVAVQRGNAASVLGTTGLAVQILPFFLSSLLLFIFLLLSQLLFFFSVVFMFLWRAYVLFVFPLFIYLSCSSRFPLPFSPFFLLIPFPWCSFTSTCAL